MRTPAELAALLSRVKVVVAEPPAAAPGLSDDDRAAWESYRARCRAVGVYVDGVSIWPAFIEQESKIGQTVNALLAAHFKVTDDEQAAFVAQYLPKEKAP